eukprot:9376060-Pyramimonas_sp.AAC.1
MSPTASILSKLEESHSSAFSMACKDASTCAFPHRPPWMASSTPTTPATVSRTLLRLERV